LTTEWALAISFPSRELVPSIVVAFTLVVVAVAPVVGAPIGSLAGQKGIVRRWLHVAVDVERP
jgi:hypothetical protein